MSDTLEHETYDFIDWLADISDDTLQKAFEAAGGQAYSDDGLVTVRGLDLETAKKIARSYQADYAGYVFSNTGSAADCQMKDVTPVKKPLLSI